MSAALALAVKAGLVYESDGELLASWKEDVDLTPHLQRFVELLGAPSTDDHRAACLERAQKHPVVLEIMADCAGAIETEEFSMRESGFGMFDGGDWQAVRDKLRVEAAAIRAAEPSAWPVLVDAQPAASRLPPALTCDDDAETPEQAWAFWKGIVCNEDGSINLEQLKLELCDASNFMRFAAIVYDYATGGQCTKINTHPSVVKTLIDDHIASLDDDESEAPTDQRFDWGELRQISELPDVDEAIRALLENRDEDNAVCMVRAIVEAAGDRLAAIVQSNDTLQALHDQLYLAQRTESVETREAAISRARLLLSQYRAAPDGRPYLGRYATGAEVKVCDAPLNPLDHEQTR